MATKKRKTKAEKEAEAAAKAAEATSEETQPEETKEEPTEASEPTPEPTEESAQPEQESAQESAQESEAPAEETPQESPADDTTEAEATDSQDALRKATERGPKNLKIGSYEVKGNDENNLRRMVELHYRRKGQRFRSVNLTQAKLDSLLQDPTFTRQLGYLSKYAPSARK